MCFLVYFGDLAALYQFSCYNLTELSYISNKQFQHINLSKINASVYMGSFGDICGVVSVICTT